MQNKFNLNDIEALVIDMDGVLWEGDTPLPGLTKFFDFLRDHAIPYILATNNAMKTPEQYQQKLAGMGVRAVERERILTSSLATADYLVREFPQKGRAYIVGQEGLREAVREAGFSIAEDDNQAVEVVVAGLDMTLTYEKLKCASLLIQRGARFVGTNGDFTLPTEKGQFPGAGSILAAIQTATGVKPTTIGKPESLMFEIAVQRMGSRPERTAMVGDRLETDILGGQRAGLKTIFVTTGVDDEASITKKGVEPDVIFSGIDELVDVWLEHRQ